jgi:hypothetical protein
MNDGVATPVHDSAHLSALGAHGTCLHELDPNAFRDFPDIVIETNDKNTPIEDLEEVLREVDLFVSRCSIVIDRAAVVLCSQRRIRCRRSINSLRPIM